MQYSQFVYAPNNFHLKMKKIFDIADLNAFLQLVRQQTRWD